MDGPAIEHSDSDSGDSWTLLENSADTPELSGESPPSFIENHEKDEDTDGISIISDSEPDSPSPCQIIYEPLEENHTPEHETAEYVSVDPQLANLQNAHESIEEDDLFDDNRSKGITYAYRQNMDLVFNILIFAIMITLVGVAIGIMWGAKTDRTLQNTPGVHKILSRLYQLQEENAYLRSKLKEISALNNHQANNKVTLKQNKCKKVFEESLQNDNTKKPTTCVDGRIDNNNRILNSHMNHNPYEKDFKQDIVNKDSINVKTAKNFKQVHKYHKNTKSSPYLENATKLKYTKKAEILEQSGNEKAADHTESRISYADSLKSSGCFKNSNNRKYDDNDESIEDQKFNEIVDAKILHQKEQLTNGIHFKKRDKRFSKSDSDKLFEAKINNNNINPNGELNGDVKVNENKRKRSEEYGADDKDDYDQKVFAIKEEIDKKFKQNYDAETDSVLDDFVKKDNRYTGTKKHKKEKKNDRKKLHKREKKRNKNEQREMKDELMKNYDDISPVSSQDNAFVVKAQNGNGGSSENLNHLSNNEIGSFSDTLDEDDEDDSSAGRFLKNVSDKSARQLNWYEHRAIMRKEARKRMEDEFFHDNPPTANWYLKRMRQRNECRAKGDNCSYRKSLAKKFKNYKTKT